MSKEKSYRRFPRLSKLPKNPKKLFQMFAAANREANEAKSKLQAEKKRKSASRLELSLTVDHRHHHYHHFDLDDADSDESDQQLLERRRAERERKQREKAAISENVNRAKRARISGEKDVSESLKRSAAAAMPPPPARAPRLPDGQLQNSAQEAAVAAAPAPLDGDALTRQLTELHAALEKASVSSLRTTPYELYTPPERPLTTELRRQQEREQLELAAAEAQRRNDEQLELDNFLQMLQSSNSVGLAAAGDQLAPDFGGSGDDTGYLSPNSTLDQRQEWQAQHNGAEIPFRRAAGRTGPSFVFKQEDSALVLRHKESMYSDEELSNGKIVEKRDKLKLPTDIYETAWPLSMFAEARKDYNDSAEQRVGGKELWFEMQDRFEKLRDTLLEAANKIVPVGEQAYDCLADAVEDFVSNSAVRMQYFDSSLCNHKQVDLLAQPSLYLLPNNRFANLQGQAGVLVPLDQREFERCRYSLEMEMYPLSRSGPYRSCWKPNFDNFPSCPVYRCSDDSTGRHAETEDRLSSCFRETPNARYMVLPEQATYANDGEDRVFCTCVYAQTVVLCANAEHIHCKHQGQRDYRGEFGEPLSYADRAGKDLRSIVAASTFGRATNARWKLLLRVCREMNSGRHGDELWRVYRRALRANSRTAALVDCLDEFSYKDSQEIVFGKPHEYNDQRGYNSSSSPVSIDNRMISVQHYEHRSHDRFFAHDPLQVSLAILLFVKTRNSALWLNAWKFWVECLRQHCRKCPSCFLALRPAFFELVVYNAMLPVMTHDMSRHIEKLAGALRYQRG